MGRWFPFFEWWAGLGGWARYGLPVALLLTSTLLLLNGTLWIWGWVIGGILLCFAGASDSEKKGYHF